MSKKTKRTISSLIKSRPKGRFAPKGFDLLGEGERIVLGEDEELTYEYSGNILSIAAREASSMGDSPTLLVDAPLQKKKASKGIDEGSFIGSLAKEKITTVKNATARLAEESTARKSFTAAKNAEATSAVVKNTTAGFAEEKYAIAKLGRSKSATVKKATVKNNQATVAAVSFHKEKYAIEATTAGKSSIADSAAVKYAIEGFDGSGSADAMSAIAKFVQEKAAMAETAVVKSVPSEKETRLKREGSKIGVTATKVAYRQAQEELARLRAERKTSTLIDNYIVDNLLAELGPTQAIVYIYLWRRIVGSGVTKISLSMQVLSEAIGVSKRTSQEAIKKLNELKLLKSDREGETGVSQHQIFKPWEKMK